MQDISRTKPDGAPGLFRFNMSFERGLFAGAARFGAPNRRRKVCLVLNWERHRFQMFLVDIAGQDIQDIREHGDAPGGRLAPRRAWLATHRTFRSDLRDILAEIGVRSPQGVLAASANVASAWRLGKAEGGEAGRARRV
jgi:hypothetical protein